MVTVFLSYVNLRELHLLQKSNEKLSPRSNCIKFERKCIPDSASHQSEAYMQQFANFDCKKNWSWRASLGIMETQWTAPFKHLGIILPWCWRVFFLNIIKSTRNQNVSTISRLIWNQTGVHLVPNQLENGKYNLNPGLFDKISKRCLCICDCQLCRHGGVSKTFLFVV